jgi:hypothetical protein
MGASKPSRWFEQSINEQCGARLAVDGRVGPGVIAAYKSCQTRLGAARLCVGTLNSLDSKQRAEYERLVRVNPKLRVFLRGWIANRVGNVDRRKCSKGDNMNIVEDAALAAVPGGSGLKLALKLAPFPRDRLLIGFVLWQRNTISTQVGTAERRGATDYGLDRRERVGASANRQVRTTADRQRRNRRRRRKTA